MNLTYMLSIRAKIFIEIEDDKYISQLPQKFSRYWISKSIKELEELNLIKAIKEKKIKRLYLTKKGKKVQELLRKINERLQR